MKRYTAFFAILPLLLILAACGKSQSTTTNSTRAGQATPTVAPPHFYKVGETVTMQPWEITLKSAKPADIATYLPPDESLPNTKPDDRLLVLGEHVKNISSQVQPWSNTQIHLQNDTGSDDYGYIMEGKDIRGSISPTMQGDGLEAYIIPGDVHLFYWTYTSNDGLQQALWQINI
jgi:hypothetical protein